MWRAVLQAVPRLFRTGRTRPTSTSCKKSDSDDDSKRPNDAHGFDFSANFHHTHRPFGTNSCLPLHVSHSGDEPPPRLALDKAKLWKVVAHCHTTAFENYNTQKDEAKIEASPLKKDIRTPSPTKSGATPFSYPPTVRRHAAKATVTATSIETAKSDLASYLDDMKRKYCFAAYLQFLDFLKASDFDNAFLKLKQAGDLCSNAQIHYNLGVMYDRAMGTDRDMERAVWHFRKAGEQGHSDALYNLAVYHKNEWVDIPAGDIQIGLWLQKAAQGGSKEAAQSLKVGNFELSFNLRKTVSSSRAPRSKEGSVRAVKSDSDLLKRGGKNLTMPLRLTRSVLDLPMYLFNGDLPVVEPVIFR